MDKILRIDMRAKGGPKAKTIPVGEYGGLGGRGLTSAIVSKEVPPTCHPLGDENKAVIAPGLLRGTAAAVAGRVFGVERVPVVKGQALPAYDSRALQGIGVTYATSPMGADHTSGYATATSILRVRGLC